MSHSQISEMQYVESWGGSDMYLGANKLVCFLWEYVSIVSYCMEAEIKIQGDVLVKGPRPCCLPTT